MDKSDLVDLQITAISCITIWFRGPGGTTKRELNRVLFFCFVVPDLRSLEWERNARYQTKKREDLSFFSFVPPQGWHKPAQSSTEEVLLYHLRDEHLLRLVALCQVFLFPTHHDLSHFCLLCRHQPIGSYIQIIVMQLQTYYSFQGTMNNYYYIDMDSNI